MDCSETRYPIGLQYSHSACIKPHDKVQLGFDNYGLSHLSAVSRRSCMPQHENICYVVTFTTVRCGCCCCCCSCSCRSCSRCRRLPLRLLAARGIHDACKRSHRCTTTASGNRLARLSVSKAGRAPCKPQTSGTWRTQVQTPHDCTWKPYCMSQAECWVEGFLTTGRRLHWQPAKPAARRTCAAC
jgi:hypothetical protein